MLNEVEIAESDTPAPINVAKRMAFILQRVRRFGVSQLMVATNPIAAA